MRIFRVDEKTSLLALLALALGLTCPAEQSHAATKSWQAESDSLITFTRASDWRCLDRDGCSTCRNVSPGDSEIIVDRGEGRAKEHYDIPAGYTLEVCRPAGQAL